MGCDRTDPLRRLDPVLSRLDLRLEYLRNHESSIDEGDIGQMRYDYEEPKRVLLEVDMEVKAALTRTFPGLIISSSPAANSCLRTQCVA